MISIGHGVFVDGKVMTESLHTLTVYVVFWPRLRLRRLIPPFHSSGPIATLPTMVDLEIEAKAELYKLGGDMWLEREAFTVYEDGHKIRVSKHPQIALKLRRFLQTFKEGVSRMKEGMCKLQCLTYIRR